MKRGQVPPPASISHLPGSCHPIARTAEEDRQLLPGCWASQGSALQIWLLTTGLHHKPQFTRAPWNGVLTPRLAVWGSPTSSPGSCVLLPRAYPVSSSWSPYNQQSQLRISNRSIPHLQKRLSCSPGCCVILLRCVILPTQPLRVCPALKVTGLVGDSLTLLYLHNARGTPIDLTSTSPFASRSLIKIKINLETGELHQ